MTCPGAGGNDFSPSLTNSASANQSDVNDFLRSTEIIDWSHPLVWKQAQQLAAENIMATAKCCFEFVRDEIQHSFDFRLNPVTCRASDVLQTRTGYCYAKSHLLAALLRANAIPAGLCYQRLRLDDEKDQAPSYCLHGLNAVYLPDVGWYRMDARGNKRSVNAQFVPPVERLAFAAIEVGEMDLPQIWADPLPEVVTALQAHTTYDQLAEHLPDLAPARH